jgi:hypothetical protein
MIPAMTAANTPTVNSTAKPSFRYSHHILPFRLRSRGSAVMGSHPLDFCARLHCVHLASLRRLRRLLMLMLGSTTLSCMCVPSG